MKKAMIDPITGEVVEVWLIGRDLQYADRGFVKVFYAFLRDIMQNKRIAGKSIRLFLYMLDRLDWNDLEIFVLPKQAAKELKIAERTYHIWVQDLLEEGLIERLGRNHYKLKPYTVVRGNMYSVNQKANALMR